MNKFEEEILEDPEEEKYDMEINQDEDFHYWSDKKIMDKIKDLEEKIQEAVENLPPDCDEEGPEAAYVEEMIHEQEIFELELSDRERLGWAR